MTLPTFLIIGAAKAGTTSLSYYLSLHPEVDVYRDREPHFFAADLPAGVSVGREAVRSLAAYERLFSRVAPARGESSPAYSQHPARPGVPARIRALLPAVKLIYLVRDPIDRLVSHYMHQVSGEGETRSLADAVGDLDDPLNIYVCAGRYATQLRAYLEYFDSGQILVIDQAGLANERPATLRRVFTFLSVDPEFHSVEFDRELNTAAEMIQRLPGYRLAYSEQGTRVRQMLPQSVRQRLRRRVDRLARTVLTAPTKPVVSDELRERLSLLFRPEVEELRELTGQRFETWSL